MSTIAPETFGPLGDATLMSLAWEQEGRDLAINLKLPGGTTHRFAFTWVDRLIVSIQQRENGPSQPLSWEGGAEQLPGGRVKVSLDFADHGEISFECNEIIEIFADGT